jgi:DnaJ-class molecular chaperone
MLGGRVDNGPGLEGTFTIQIPEGTEDGSSFRIKRRGMPRFGDERGDEYVAVKISLPKRLAEEERNLFKELERLRMLNLDPASLSQPCFGFPALPLKKEKAK